MKIEILPKIEKSKNKDEIKKILEKEKASMASTINTLKEYPAFKEDILIDKNKNQ